MKCYLDSNVLIYFKQENSPFFPQAKKILLGLIQSDASVFISPLTLDETLFQLRTLLLLEKTQQKQLYKLLNTTLQGLLALPNLTLINPPTEKKKQQRILSFMQHYKLRPRDAYHLLTMQEHHIQHFATFDSDFARVFDQHLLQKYEP